MNGASYKNFLFLYNQTDAKLVCGLSRSFMQLLKSSCREILFDLLFRMLD